MRIHTTARGNKVRRPCGTKYELLILHEWERLRARVRARVRSRRTEGKGKGVADYPFALRQWQSSADHGTELIPRSSETDRDRPRSIRDELKSGPNLRRDRPSSPDRVAVEDRLTRSLVLLAARKDFPESKSLIPGVKVGVAGSG